MPEIRVIIPKNMDTALESLIRAGIAGNKAEIVRNSITQYLSSVPTILSRNYDLESVFSPDGRILQVEYATEASKKGLISVGIRCKDGLVITKRKPSSNQLANPQLESNSYFRTIKKITDKVDISISGITTDAYLVLKRAREYTSSIEKIKKLNIYELVEELSFYFHSYTLNKDLRVLGACLLVAGLNLNNEPVLFILEPSGSPYEVHLAAIGRGSDEANKNMLENFKDDISLEEGIALAIKTTLQNSQDLDNIIVDIIDTKTGIFRELSLEEKKKYNKNF